MQHVLRVSNSPNYVISDARVEGELFHITLPIKFGYRYEAKKFDDYEAAFDIAAAIMEQKKDLSLEIEELV